MAEDTRESSQIEEHSVSSVSSGQTENTAAENVGEKSETSQNDLTTVSADLSDKFDEIDTSNIHYEGKVCVYTDPATKHQYIWDSNKNEWVLRTYGIKPLEVDSLETSTESRLKTESVAQSGTTEDSKLHCTPNGGQSSRNDYEFDGEHYCYKDLKTGKRS
jgi:hypothetical protein